MVQIGIIRGLDQGASPDINDNIGFVPPAKGNTSAATRRTLEELAAEMLRSKKSNPTPKYNPRIAREIMQAKFTGVYTLKGGNFTDCREARKGISELLKAINVYDTTPYEPVVMRGEQGSISEDIMSKLRNCTEPSKALSKLETSELIQLGRHVAAFNAICSRLTPQPKLVSLDKVIDEIVSRNQASEAKAKTTDEATSEPRRRGRPPRKTA